VDNSIENIGIDAWVKLCDTNYVVCSSQQDTILLETGKAAYSYGVYRKEDNRPICLCRNKSDAQTIAAMFEDLKK